MISRKLADINKRSRDAGRMSYYPSIDEIKTEVRKAMGRLWVIQQYCIAEGLLVDMPFALRVQAACALVGIVFFNAFAGRAGEWAIMLADYVKEQAAAGSTLLLCSTHKTSTTYGSIAKYIPAGSMEAFRIYLSLPGKHSDRFVEHPTKGGTVSIAGLLKKFGAAAFALDDPPNSNLVRKYFHTALLRVGLQKDLLKHMVTIDGHSENVARKVYVIRSPEDDAELARILFTEVCGEPVPKHRILNARTCIRHWPCHPQYTQLCGF